MTDPVPALAEIQVWRTVYRKRGKSAFPYTYSESRNLGNQREDLAYLRKDENVAESWIETRIEHPWERTDD